MTACGKELSQRELIRQIKGHLAQLSPTELKILLLMLEKFRRHQITEIQLHRIILMIERYARHS